MLPAIKAEFRKVLTVRSTYIIMILSLVMIGLFAFYGSGVKFSGETNNQFYLQEQVNNAVNALALLFTLIGVLLMTHEYRYNTITYTLTNTNRRSKVLAAKIIVVSVVAIALTWAAGVLSPLTTAWGLELKGVDLTHQVFYFKDLFWHVTLYGWGFAMIGLILATVIRNQIGVIASLFLIPAMVEPLLGVVLKHNVVYLPFSALNIVVNVQAQGSRISQSRASVIALVYIIVGWFVAWWLFLKRDAN